MLSLANGLAQAGHSVELLLVMRTGVLLAQVDPLVQIVDLGQQRAVSAVPQIRAYLRRQQPAVLFTALPTVNIIGITANILAGCPTAVIPVEHMPVSIDARENQSLEPKLAYLLYPLFYRFATRVVLNCEEARDDFLRTYPSVPTAKVRKIFNPVVTGGLLAAMQQPPTLPWLQKRDPANPVLIGAGRLVRQKNFPALIEAFAIVRRQRACRLVIMGTGEDRSRLEQLIQQHGLHDDVLLAGYVANPYACMAHADLFVLSSIYETLPTVVIEALACGLPVVATPCTGVREILDEGKFGTLVPGFAPDALAAAILSALGAPMAGSVLQNRAAEFSADRAIATYGAMIAEVSGGAAETAG